MAFAPLALFPLRKTVEGRVAAFVWIIGAIGILTRAKARGLVQEIRPMLYRLENELRFFISPSLRAQALRLAGE